MKVQCLPNLKVNENVENEKKFKLFNISSTLFKNLNKFGSILGSNTVLYNEKQRSVRKEQSSETIKQDIYTYFEVYGEQHFSCQLTGKRTESFIEHILFLLYKTFAVLYKV